MCIYFHNYDHNVGPFYGFLINLHIFNNQHKIAYFTNKADNLVVDTYSFQGTMEVHIVFNI